MTDPRIARIEWAALQGQRPRPAGPNAHMEAHGGSVRVPVARVTLDDESSGFCWSDLDQATAIELVGAPLDEAFNPGRGVADRFHPIEGPLWDLAGRRASLPVYRLTTAITGVEPPSGPLRVRCYDTTLYLDDLDIADHDAAGEHMAAEAMQGWERGHRAFKIKIGRANLHMPTFEGLQRDVAVVNAIRRAVGPEAPVMADANNGYNLNLSRDFLSATAESKLFWLEEALPEDPVLYRRLHAWIASEGMATYIGDGEGRPSVDPYDTITPSGPGPRMSSRGVPSPLLMEMAQEGIVDVVQYDIWRPGITRWLEVGPQLDSWGRLSAPHHYGSHLGNYVAPHVAPAIRGFQFAEWDEATTPGITAPDYRVSDGYVHVPDSPGFGLDLDEDTFQRSVREDGFTVTK